MQFLRKRILILVCFCFTLFLNADGLFFSNVKNSSISNDYLFVLSSDYDNLYFSIFDLRNSPDLEFCSRTKIEVKDGYIRRGIENFVVTSKYVYLPMREGFYVLNVTDPKMVIDIGKIEYKPNTNQKEELFGKELYLNFQDDYMFGFVRRENPNSDMPLRAISRFEFDGDSLTSNDLMELPGGESSYFYNSYYRISNFKSYNEFISIFISLDRDSSTKNDPNLLYICQIEDNDSIRLKKTYELDTVPLSVSFINRNYLYLIFYEKIDVYNMAENNKIISLPNSTHINKYTGLAEHNNFLYCTFSDSIKIFDITNPSVFNEVDNVKIPNSKLPILFNKGMGFLFTENGRLRVFNAESDGSLTQLFTEEMLWNAINTKNYKQIDYLINHGISPGDWYSYEINGERISEPLFYHALRLDDPELLEYLLKRTIDYFHWPESESLFKTAARFGSIKCMPIAKKYGMDAINAAGYASVAPLFIAVRNGNLQIVEKLLEYGADINVKKRMGGGYINALSEAKNEGMKDLLVQRGIKTIEHFDKPIKGIVKTDGLRIRSEESLSGSIIGKVNKDEIVGVTDITYWHDTIDGINAPWYKIQTYDTTVGWCFGGYIYLPSFDGP